MLSVKKITALCLSLLFCLALLPGAALADTCTEHTFVLSDATVPATIGADGTAEYVCSVCGEKKTEIVPAIASVTLHPSSAAYKGKAQRPEIIATDSLGERIDSANYTVSLATAQGVTVPFCKAIGKYTVTVTFTGKYAGETALTFKIVPPATDGISVTLAGSTVTVEYAPVEGATGYQVYYSKHKKGPFKKIAVTSKTYCTHKIALGRDYYFKVRAYKKTADGNIFGKWSSTIKISA